MLTQTHFDLRNRIIHHSVYSHINTLSDLCVFMEHHVVAVWDFMTLLKALQAKFTCVTTPWLPTKDPILRRMINEITLAEESDTFEEGVVLSHFEFYIRAMKEAGANTLPIETLLHKLQDEPDYLAVIHSSDLPETAKRFVLTTLEEVASQKWHAIAASFAYSREGLIPDMFDKIVYELSVRFPNKLNQFVQYLNRHIELDGDSHGQLAEAMVLRLCANDPQKIEEAQQAITRSLQARLALWDAIDSKIKSSL